MDTNEVPSHDDDIDTVSRGQNDDEKIYVGRGVEDQKLVDIITSPTCSEHSSKMVLISVTTLILVMYIPWGMAFYQERNDYFARQKYPLCRVQTNNGQIHEANFTSLGNGHCNTTLNTDICGYDGTDCARLDELYPSCNITDLAKLGDGTCDWDVNTKVCGWDHGDCFNARVPRCHKVDNPKLLGNGKCDGGFYDTHDCEWDGGDCVDKSFAERKGEDCSSHPLFVKHWNSMSEKFGDGTCDNIFNDLNNPDDKCLLQEGGDCKDLNDFFGKFKDCSIHNLVPTKLINGICDDEYPYNTFECNFDNGECLKECEYRDEKLGDGICDPFPYNTEECNFDLGDCSS